MKGVYVAMLTSFLLVGCVADDDGLRDEAVASLLDNGDQDEIQSLLNWAIENSDPQVLKDLAESVRVGDPETLEQRRQKVQDMMADMKNWPTEAELLTRSLETVHNRSEPVTSRTIALQLMQELVEQVDLANDLHKMSIQMNTSHEPASKVQALEVLSQALQEDGLVQEAALRVVAVAASNNLPFQTTFLQAQPLIVPWLLQELVDKVSADAPDLSAISAVLQALSALSRNLPASETKILDLLEITTTQAKHSVYSGHDALTMLFTVARNLCSAAHFEPEASRRKCKQMVHRSLALLTDWALNDSVVRGRLAVSGECARLWLGMCQELPDEAIDSADRLVSLLHAALAITAVPAVGEGEAAAVHGAWSPVRSCVLGLHKRLRKLPAQDEFVAASVRVVAAAVELLNEWALASDPHGAEL